MIISISRYDSGFLFNKAANLNTENNRLITTQFVYQPVLEAGVCSSDVWCRPHNQVGDSMEEGDGPPYHHGEDLHHQGDGDTEVVRCLGDV